MLLPFPEGASLVEKSDIIQATAQAEIPADTAAKPLQVLTSHAKLIETEELSRRIEALEAHLR